MKSEADNLSLPHVVGGDDIDQQRDIYIQENRTNYLSCTEDNILMSKTVNKAKKPSSRYHNPMRRKTAICYHWKRGRCQLGKECNFIHPDIDTATGSINEEVAFDALKDISDDSTNSEALRKIRSDDSSHDNHTARGPASSEANQWFHDLSYGDPFIESRQIYYLPPVDPLYFGYATLMPAVNQHLPPFLGPNHQLPYGVTGGVQPHFGKSGLVFYTANSTGCYPSVNTYQPSPYLHL